MRSGDRISARALTSAEVDLAKRLASGLPDSERLISSSPTWRGAQSCGCGCASYYVFPSGSICTQQGGLANEAEAIDEHGNHHMVLLFTCAAGLHEVEIAPLNDAEDPFLPSVAQLNWVDK